MAATKARLAAQLRDNEERNRHAREEKEAVLRQLQELKNKMNQARAEAHDNLARLTAQSNAALKALARVVGKVRPGPPVMRPGVPPSPLPAPFSPSSSQAERILRLAEMCRRLETEGEKVLPFYPSSLAEGELFDADKVLKEEPAEPLAQVRRLQWALRDRGPSGTAWLAHGQLQELLPFSPCLSPRPCRTT